MKEPLEIERKYLILRPDPEELVQRCCAVYDIEQTYLTAPEHITARVRRRTGEREEFFYTEKERISDRTCIERERQIDREEYEQLLQGRDERVLCVQKRRFCLKHEGLLFEIDIYPFWKRLAVMEVELEREEQSVSLPREIAVIREVSGDRRLKNAALARKIPDENELMNE